MNNNENQLVSYIFQGSQLRSFEKDGEICVIAKDVTEALGYVWQRNLISHVPEEWKGVNPINSLGGGIQDMLYLTEPGLYFFLARSDKPLALPFQKWIAGEVIPSIRKTGKYGIPEEFIQKTRDKIDEMVQNADIPLNFQSLGTISGLSRFMKLWVERNLACVHKITERNELSLLRHQLSELAWAYDDIRNLYKHASSAEILLKAQKEFEQERENVKLSVYY
ncbi:MAG: hypothetical protein LBH43_18115 [Treponema sp.]|jgi:prophage antirepressor-like protein|nr:hypothetical protein [Treponema sp.]